MTSLWITPLERHLPLLKPGKGMTRRHGKTTSAGNIKGGIGGNYFNYTRRPTINSTEGDNFLRRIYAAMKELIQGLVFIAREPLCINDCLPFVFHLGNPCLPAKPTTKFSHGFSHLHMQCAHWLTTLNILLEIW